MTNVPQNPKIYHITHISNLEGILGDKVIWSDAKRIERNLECEIVGMSEIKQRRLQELEVECHIGTKVGEYVPFYFCPRSIMLYILFKRNHPDITYRGGQELILHLQADLGMTIEWADRYKVKWAFSDGNAGTRVANFYNNLADLDKINWKAVMATDFRCSSISEGKQAEFLMYESFPLELVEKIGVYSSRIRDEVMQQLGGVSLPVNIEANWYYPRQD